MGMVQLKVQCVGSPSHLVKTQAAEPKGSMNGGNTTYDSNVLDVQGGICVVDLTYGM